MTTKGNGMLLVGHELESLFPRNLREISNQWPQFCSKLMKQWRGGMELVSTYIKWLCWQSICVGEGSCAQEFSKCFGVAKKQVDKGNPSDKNILNIEEALGTYWSLKVVQEMKVLNELPQIAYPCSCVDKWSVKRWKELRNEQFSECREVLVLEEYVFEAALLNILSWKWHE